MAKRLRQQAATLRSGVRVPPSALYLSGLKPDNWRVVGSEWFVENKVEFEQGRELFSIGAKRKQFEMPEHKEDLYGHKAKYENALRRLNQWENSEGNKELLNRFNLHMCAEGLSLARKVKYLHILMKIATIVNKYIVHLDGQDLQDFKIWLNYSELQQSTKEDHDKLKERLTIVAKKLNKFMQSVDKKVKND